MNSIRLAVIGIAAACAVGIAGIGGAESSSNHRAMLGPRLIESLQKVHSPSDKIAINVSLKRDDLAAPGRARRAAVRARQHRVLGSLTRGTLNLAYRFESLSGFSGRIPVSRLDAGN
jgi:hypothetical protein